ncbi:flagellin [Clostridia bacterium]|nr:flagellin [Clostridia bacterium]GHU75033.1 flagellin [Clostridia bacterium]
MVVANNIPALTAIRNMGRANKAVAKSSNNLSMGYKINSAADDAAGLAIANKLRVQVDGLNTASRNSSDAVALIQTAEGALSEVHSILQRIRELSVQAANDTLAHDTDAVNPQDPENADISSDVAKIQMEVDALLEEITAISKKTEYNKIKILSGEVYKYQPGDEDKYQDNPSTMVNFINDLTFQVGPNQHMELDFSIPKFTSRTLGLVGNGLYADKSTPDAEFPDYDRVHFDLQSYKFMSDYKQTEEGKRDYDNVERNNAGDPVRRDGTVIPVDALGKPTNPADETELIPVENPITRIDKAIGFVSELRAKLGATQNRLEHTISSLDITSVNTEEARSRIQDTDVAYEMTVYSAKNVIAQAGMAILSQANNRPQSILQLLN